MWLLLIHQIPPRPNYLRVKIWRQLQRLGAVPIKNTVYVLPRSDGALEHMQWVLREVVAGGGEGTIVEARLVDGITDQAVEALFNAARDAEYAQLAVEARALAAELPRRRKVKPDERAAVSAQLARLEQRMADLLAIDFFGASGRETAHGLLESIAGRVRAEQPARASWKANDVRGRTWVTRTGIHVDRIACAWLIRRFIDPAARFKFVAARGYQPSKGELRFDMFEAEFTHEGDRCSFEVLIERFGLRDRGLVQIAEIVHDIDLRDGKFGRSDADGVARLIAGLCLGHRDDEARLARGGDLFEDLYRVFSRRKEKDPA